MIKSEFLIGATSSGSGKTTLTIGLLRALKNRGFQVQPFKCGPDYIDIKFHELAAGTPSVNLDLFLSSSAHMKSIYDKHTSRSAIAVTEGVMGLYDGYDKWKGSSAQIAEELNLPIILVLNPKAMAYSVAPILYGFKEFNKKLNIVGVIFNMVNSESYRRILEDACNDIDIPMLGCLPKNEELTVPSRHLGLNIDSINLLDRFAQKAADFVEKHVQIDTLLNLTNRTNKITKSQNASLFNNRRINKNKFKSAVAHDEAFTFSYHENIEYLKQCGDVEFFSPIYDKELPVADFIYLPGGYPELYLKQLANNISMKNSIKQYVEKGGYLLAECGGMMYLSSCIKDKFGNDFPMVNIFKEKVDAQSMKLTLGYRSFIYNNLSLKGHEFHYSTMSGNTESVVQQYNAKGISVETKLMRYKNALAGYTHLYWAEMDDLLALFDS